MIKKSIRLYAVVICLSFTYACNLPQPDQKSELAGIVAQTQTAISVNSYLQTAAFQQTVHSTVTPQATFINLSLTPTNTPSNTHTITPLISQTEIINSTQAATHTPSQSNCINAVKFINETVMDGTIFAPGQEFIKTWTLRNVGTCVWGSDYELVHYQGEKMNGTSPSPIGQTVVPGASIQLYLPQTAPSTPGIYQGFWKLRSSTGEEFGLGQNSDTAFWVKIQVEEGVPNPETGAIPSSLGKADWSISFENKSTPWYLGPDSDVEYQISDGKLVIRTLKPTADQWRVAGSINLKDFYLQAVFKTSPICSEKDGYGLLVRAPDNINGNINSGLVFSFSCDGHYRVYRMDDGVYAGIQNWTSSSAIKAGGGQSNIMWISAKGSDFQLFANDTLIFQFSDQTFQDGLFGLVIRSVSGNTFEVLVDEVAYWNIP